MNLKKKLKRLPIRLLTEDEFNKHINDYKDLELVKNNHRFIGYKEAVEMYKSNYCNLFRHTLRYLFRGSYMFDNDTKTYNFFKSYEKYKKFFYWYAKVYCPLR